ncbi:unnamed protein product [Phytophthora fragariaefolia]|uniref:Unnamed protein product n=1 Tax=Phytophthora fragariaefolia TaxID=1490495 RepID=A0A9W6XQM2_9STRA|nr:unnamed protein product [Phytophthora fragariaefolia]
MSGGIKSQGAGGVDNGDASSRIENNGGGPREEKVKVVVRVRPLQPKEEEWPKAAEAGNSTAPATITIKVMWLEVHSRCTTTDAV